MIPVSKHEPYCAKSWHINMPWTHKEYLDAKCQAAPDVFAKWFNLVKINYLYVEKKFWGLYPIENLDTQIFISVKFSPSHLLRSQGDYMFLPVVSRRIARCQFWTEILSVMFNCPVQLSFQYYSQDMMVFFEATIWFFTQMFILGSSFPWNKHISVGNSFVNVT